MNLTESGAVDVKFVAVKIDVRIGFIGVSKTGDVAVGSEGDLAGTVELERDRFGGILGINRTVKSGVSGEF